MENNEYEFMDGSIYRVKMSNFLTYTDAEFFPGPRLNVVLGPNGTGKSSIVCAICLGLGGKEKLLGRAEKLSQYVRHEEKYAFTEIELYFDKGKKNKTIRRDFNRDANSSRWFINGRGATQKDISNLMNEANIQIDNLCQFLPQDKVNTFSQLNAQELLKETEKAIYDGELFRQHNELIEHHSNYKKIIRDRDGMLSRLNAKKNENEQRGREVGRLEEHKRRLEETEILEKKCFWAKHTERQMELEQVKEDKSNARQQLQNITQTQLGPLKEKQNEAEELSDRLSENVTSIVQRRKTLKKATDSVAKKIEDLEVDHRSTRDALERSKSERHRKESELAARKKKLEDFENENSADPNAHAQLQQQKRDEEDRLGPIRMQMSQNDDEWKRKKRNVDRSSLQRDQIEARISKLKNESFQKRNQMQHYESDAMEAFDWINENSDKFHRKVWGPIALEIQVLDNSDVQMVESMIRGDLLASFVVECREDYDTLISEFNEHRRKKIGVYNIQDGRVRQCQRPFSDGTMSTLRNQYGIKCYLDEAIKVEPVVLECLRNMSSVHQVLLGTTLTENKINNDESSALFRFALENSSGRRVAVVTPEHKYQSSESRYMRNDTTTSVGHVQARGLLAGSPGNEDEINELIHQRSLIGADIERISNEMEATKHGLVKLKEKENEILRKSSEIRNTLKGYSERHRRILNEKRRIQQLENELRMGIDEEEESLSNKMKNQIASYSRLLLQHATKLHDLLKITKSHVECQVNSNIHRCASETYSTECRRIEQLVGTLHREYNRKRERVTEVKREVQALRKAAEKNAPLDHYQEIFEQYPDNLNELLSRIANNRAAMEHFRGDLGIIQEYERKQREIEKDEEALNAVETRVETISAAICDIKEPWHEKLKRLIADINASFSQFFKEIGCVGEVVLDDTLDDVSLWGIERRAQFRESTKLTTMSAHEQSGGEKSVGTIMYMMALQNLTECPFRVVDEINQGMDQRNERKVFDRITRSSCGKKLPQYFMITPKLITGLEYHENTKVIVIMNGSYGLPQSEWDSKHFLKIARALKNGDSPPQKKQRNK